MHGIAYLSKAPILVERNVTTYVDICQRLHGDPSSRPLKSASAHRLADPFTMSSLV